MRHTSTALLLAALSFQSLEASAETTDDELIVTATRTGGVNSRLYGGSATIFLPQEMEARQIRNVADILSEAPSSNVSRQGALGGLTTARIRGGEGNHALVLIDGIEANDPYQGEFDFAALIADEGARLEILRGQQSALYGSDAIGGVVHYITPSGREASGFSARVEAGSFDTTAASARLGGAQGDFEGSVAASVYSTGGTNISRNGDERDGYENRALSARGSFSVSDSLTMRAVARITHSQGDFDDASFGAPVDGPETYRYNAFYGLFGADLSLMDGDWTHALTTQYVNGARRDVTPFFSNFVDGSRQKASYVTALRFGILDMRHTLTSAIDYERETYQNVSPPGLFTPPTALQERVLETTGYVLAYDLSRSDTIGFSVAARHDANSRFDSANTYRAQLSWLARPWLRLRGAVGTGVKNPTNYELFGFDPPVFVGNPDLRPEESVGWEVGADFEPTETSDLTLTYFASELEHEITGGFFSTPTNLPTASRQRGLEAELNVRLGEGWRLQASYAWLSARQNGVREIRRPEHSGAVALFWRAADDRGGTGFVARYAGQVDDEDFASFPATRIRLEGFTTVTLTADWRLTEHMEVYGRVENATNEEYEQVLGFRAPGRAAIAGLRTSF